MSLYGLLTTSASGMSAQTALLSTVSDNIANASTTGYKDASAEFSTLVLDTGVSDYQTGVAAFPKPLKADVFRFFVLAMH